ncbi:MAG: SGNH/GDSL hydrolase family protein [Puniceicoccaceae bacterium]
MAENKDPDTAVIHIAPIGDSITQGGVRSRPEEYTYRYPLAAMLQEAGVRFDYVGSRQEGLSPDFRWPDVNGEPFDTDHEGYYGAKTAKVRDALKTAMDQWDAPADIALIHLGTNDQKLKEGGESHAQTVGEPLKEIIGMLREKNPNVVILLGHLNFDAGTAKTKIRPVVEEVAREMNTEESPVVTVHHYEDFNENPKHPETDTFDWAHPNPRGQEKMARKWFEAMRPFLE